MRLRLRVRVRVREDRLERVRARVLSERVRVRVRLRLRVRVRVREDRLERPLGKFGDADWGRGWRRSLHQLLAVSDWLDLEGFGERPVAELEDEAHHLGDVGRCGERHGRCTEIQGGAGRCREK